MAWLCRSEVDDLRETIFAAKPLPRNSGGTEQNTRPGGKRILCLGGGGIHALFTARILAELEHQLAQKAIDEPGSKQERVCLADYFDLICGTGTGGVLALAHGVKRYSFDDLAEFIKKGLFFPSKRGELSRWYNWFVSSPKTPALYDGKLYDEILMSLFGKGDKLHAPERKDTCKVFVVAQTAENSASGKRGVLLANYQSRGKEKFNTVQNDLRLWKAARATSAAPGIYTPAYLDDEEANDDINVHPSQYYDGGLYKNNPIKLAKYEVRDNYLRDDEVKEDEEGEPNLYVYIGTKNISPVGLVSLCGNNSLARRYAVRVQSSVNESHEFAEETLDMADLFQINLELEDCSFDDMNKLRSLEKRAERYIAANKNDFESIIDRLSHR